jgi:RND family efflux transporter MFP subunit
MYKKILIFVVILITFAGGLYLAYSFGKKSAEEAVMQKATGQLAKKETPESIPTPSQPVEESQAEQEIPVKVAEVEQRDINLFQTFYGTAVPYAEANVQGKYGGKIVFLKGKEGDDVKKGEIIVRFDDSDTQLQLQQAIANKNSALEQVNQAQSNFDTIQADVERQEKLFKDGIVPQKTVDDARNGLQSAQATLNSARESVKQAEAQIDLLKNTLNDFKIAAPISGVIDEKHYNLNEVYRAGEILYHIIDIDKVYLEVEIPETYISQIKEKMDVQVFFDSLEDQEFAGIIDRIIPKGDPQSRNFLAKAIVENPERQIKPSMFSRINVRTKSIPGALIIDNKALIEEGGNFYVFKVVDNQVKKVAVEIKHREDISVAVASDELQPGNQVVVEGTDKLKTDVRIKIL